MLNLYPIRPFHLIFSVLLFVIALLPLPANAFVLETPDGITAKAEHLKPQTLQGEHSEENIRKSPLSQVRAVPDSGWQTADPGILNLSADPREHWFRLTLKNTLSQSRTLTLLLDQPLQDYIDIWLFRTPSAEPDSYQLGDYRPYTNRTDNYRGFAIPVNLNADEEISLYLRFDTFDGLHEATPVFLFEPQAYRDHLGNDSLWYGIYYGALLLLIAYNLVIGILTRERDFFFYSLYLSLFLIWNMMFRGFAHRLWPDSSWVSNHGLVILSCLLLIGLYFFSSSFLKFRQKSPRMYRAIQLLTLYQLIPLAMALSGQYATAFMAFFPGASAMMITVLLTAILQGVKGDRASRIFILAWLILLISTVVYFAQVMGLIPATPLTTNSINIGSMVEMLVLALALVDKINHLKQEQANTLAENLKLQQQNNDELERLVAEKTAQLTELNKQLKLDAITDALTGLNNRRRLPRLFEKSQQECQGQIGFILLDIDHFKQVNDIFGHQDGDQVLIRLADAMRSYWQKWTADLFRFGGEEFGIIVCHDNAQVLAEAIHQFQQHISQQPLHRQQQITISVGSVIIPAGTDTDLDQAIALSDNLLYDAKNKGRNRCFVRQL